MINRNKKKNLLHKRYEDFNILLRKILHIANQGISRIDFLKEVSRLLVKFSHCDSVEFRLEVYKKTFICESSNNGNGTSNYYVLMANKLSNQNDFEKLSNLVIKKRFEEDQNNISLNGSLWTGSSARPFILKIKSKKAQGLQVFSIKSKFKSIAFLPFEVDEQKSGLLVLKSVHKNHFNKEDIEFYEIVAQSLGVATSDRRAQFELRERIKELTCLYKISKLQEFSEISIEKMLKGVVEILPPAWLYPEITAAKIILDDKFYKTQNYRDSRSKLTAKIEIGGLTRGSVEVIYTVDKPEIDEGPFLKEERNLINEVAGQIALIVEKKQVNDESQKLQQQLRHADRLATIGQLAAGVAHELNEPLGSILGFSQLVLKNSNLSREIILDVTKIEKASLHAREVVKKLMLFARQSPADKKKIDLNRAVKEGLYFLESRCEKYGVELSADYASDLPEITADLSQLQQILINLVVNSIQAMPDGGKLKIKTFFQKDNLILSVEDSGIGMSKDIREKIFIPFFTTKDIDQGTGLGLSVVHGIVTSHGGSIHVESVPGKGSLFEIKLPIVN